MAGDGAGSPRECGSPAANEGRMGMRDGEQHSPHIIRAEQNGNGGMAPCYDSREESMDSCYDAPLDFSIKKRASSVSDCEDQHQGLRMEPISPPPVQKQEPEELRYFRPGPTVFPHVNGLHSPPMPKTENCVSPRQCKSEEKIGEPQTAMPGMVPGMTLSNSAAQLGLLPGLTTAAGLLPHAGLLNALPFLQVDTRMAGAAAAVPPPPPPAAAAKQPEEGKNGASRPFKSYPKEPLNLPLGVYGLPAVPQTISSAELSAAQAMSANSEELFNQYRQLIQRMQDSPEKAKNGRSRAKERRGSGGSTSSNVSSSSVHSGSELGSPALCTSPGLTSTTPVTIHNNNNMTPTPTKSINSRTTNAANRKRPRTIPDEQKDSAYWERRRKNNEAAKRSRDARRAKEDEIAIRAAFLEQENLKLRVEVAALKNETSKLRCMLYNS